MSDDSGTKQFNFRCRPGQLAFWEEAAKLKGLTLSSWLKQVASEAASKAFAEVDEKHGGYAKK
jgi:uncharacterized protein (DUF1778 family)